MADIKANTAPPFEPIEISFISSFDAEGIVTGRAVSDWPRETAYCELYAFTQADVHAIAAQFHYNPGFEYGATDLFAHLHLLPESDLAKIAKLLHERLGELSSLCIGFATFIPELSSVEKSRRQRGTEAMVFLCRLALELRRLGHLMHFVELVCGTTFGELCQRKSKSDASDIEIYAQVKSSPNIIDMVLDSLASVVRRKPENEKWPLLSLELEPGLSFAMSEIRDIEYIIGRIESSSELATNVGLNLDCAHWIISDCDRSILQGKGHAERRERLLQHVVHIHVSGHNQKGHFGDLLIEESEDSFKDRLTRLLQVVKAKHVSGGMPKCSGFISVEHEMIGRASAIDQSIRWLRERGF